jgi:hypothetical protein
LRDSVEKPVVDGLERLVEHQESRSMDEGTGELDLLRHTG